MEQEGELYNVQWKNLIIALCFTLNTIYNLIREYEARDSRTMAGLDPMCVGDKMTPIILSTLNCSHLGQWGVVVLSL